MKKRIIATLLSVTLIASLAACGSTSKKEEGKMIDGKKAVTLSIYTQYSDEDTKLPVDYAIAELKKEMPWVTLEIDPQAQDDGQKLKTYAATGDMPDIFNCGLEQINTFIKSENIAKLNDYVAETGYDKDILENCKDLLYHPDGNVYAFPYAGNEFTALYYNKDLFEKHGVEIPKTYDDVLAAVKKFNAEGITPISIFAQEGWITTALYDSIATKYIPEGIKGLDQGTTKITDKGYLKAAQKVAELVKENAFAKGATGLNYDQATSLFYQEEAAMYINGQWFITDADKNMAGKVDWMPFPITTDGGDNTFAVSGAGNVGGHAVSATTEDVELAAKVAAFVSKKIAEYKYVERANTIVAVKVDKEFACEVTPMIQKLSDEREELVIESTFAWGLTNAKYKTTLEEQTQALMTGAVTPEDFIKIVGQSLE